MFWRKDVSRSTDAQLLAAADRTSLEEFYRRHSAMVFRYCLQMARNADTAGEVTQLVFLAVIQQAQRFDADRGTVSAWLLAISRNQLRKQWDWQRRHESLEFENSSEDIALDRNVSLSELRQAIQELPPLFREVVVLCELEELKYEEAAGILEVPLGTVRSRLHRAKQQLAKALSGKECVKHEA
jgi:RNA polymerase sigma-70 factor, ECF subfamily